MDFRERGVNLQIIFRSGYTFSFSQFTQTTASTSNRNMGTCQSVAMPPSIGSSSKTKDELTCRSTEGVSPPTDNGNVLKLLNQQFVTLASQIEELTNKMAHHEQQVSTVKKEMGERDHRIKKEKNEHALHLRTLEKELCSQLRPVHDAEYLRKHPYIPSNTDGFAGNSVRMALYETSLGLQRDRLREETRILTTIQSEREMKEKEIQSIKNSMSEWDQKIKREKLTYQHAIATLQKEAKYNKVTIKRHRAQYQRLQRSLDELEKRHVCQMPFNADFELGDQSGGGGGGHGGCGPLM